jgi:2-polyprenyl-6-hydroxyphenyl methylase/3-demethylubiquinone-9 3-methyltransferase
MPHVHGAIIPPMTTPAIPADDRRFAFGENWRRFLSVITDERIEEATKSLRDFLGCETLAGKTFLDIGSGSGLFSLAARRLGATVISFDYDPQSVACTQELKRRYFPEDGTWRIEQGSVLDRRYVESLGQFEVCYSWGVLHHTNNLWQALHNAHLAVKPGGLLYIAIYRDEGIVSACWKVVKRAYCSGPMGKAVLTALFYPAFFCGGLAIDLVKFRNPVRRYREHIRLRGCRSSTTGLTGSAGIRMRWRPADRLVAFFENLGYRLLKLQAPGHGFGNNQFVFQKRLGRDWRPAQRFELLQRILSREQMVICMPARIGRFAVCRSRGWNSMKREVGSQFSVQPPASTLALAGGSTTAIVNL